MEGYASYVLEVKLMKDLKIPETLALCSAVAFVLAAIYVKAYSLTFGVRLNPYFSLSDYTRFAIDWLPPVCAAAVLGVLLDKFFTRVERGASESELAATSGFPKSVSFFRRSAEWAPLVVLPGIAIVTTVMAILGRIPAEFLYRHWMFAGPIIWFALVHWYSRERAMVEHWPSAWFKFVMFFPAMVIGAGFMGFAAGVSELDNSFKTRVYVEAQAAPIEGSPMFILDNYVLIQVNDSRRFIAIARDKVLMMVSPDKENIFFKRKKELSSPG